MAPQVGCAGAGALGAGGSGPCDYGRTTAGHQTPAERSKQQRRAVDNGAQQVRDDALQTSRQEIVLIVRSGGGVLSRAPEEDIFSFALARGAPARGTRGGRCAAGISVPIIAPLSSWNPLLRARRSSRAARNS